ncbi:hypothetical protein HN014_22345 (plasmid) [Aquimarina sp. TRL1]|uniref:hypothetical protein n=1 Tax=Aquimarina sp. (strain TRL1) TaxID=2736252 RepID=UPI001589B2C5|nr:hypothetical protein [Aquimarina sp. TRL1]QKX07743.1 hypothetical protein HN014_22345 [Aquimarina sp. TRL1]
MKYSEFIELLEKEKDKTGLKDPNINIGTSINDNGVIIGSIEIAAVASFENKLVKEIGIISKINSK